MEDSEQSDRIECWCLHGSVGAVGDWRGLADALGGRGISVRGFDLWKLLQCKSATLAEAGGMVNRECVAQSSARKRILVGYSLGGRIALHALLDGERIWDAAVIISAHPGLEEAGERAARREADAVWAGRAIRGDWQDFLQSWDAQPVLGGGGSAGLVDRKSLVLRRNEVARSFVSWSLGAQEPLWGRLGEIRCPVLWVVGEWDEKFRTIAERAMPEIPGARLWLARDAGHRVPWDVPAAFAQQVEGICDEIR